MGAGVGGVFEEVGYYSFAVCEGGEMGCGVGVSGVGVMGGVCCGGLDMTGVLGVGIGGGG